MRPHRRSGDTWLEFHGRINDSEVSTYLVSKQPAGSAGTAWMAASGKERPKECRGGPKKMHRVLQSLQNPLVLFKRSAIARTGDSGPPGYASSCGSSVS